MKAVHGDAPWPVRRYVLSGLLALFILGAGFGSWAVLANISGAIITTGRIQEARTRQVIQHPQGGVVAQVLVREGDSVAADAPLIVLDDQALQSELNIVEIQMFEMMARHARLQAERDQAAEITFEAALTSPGAPGQPGSGHRKDYGRSASAFRGAQPVAEPPGSGIGAQNPADRDSNIRNERATDRAGYPVVTGL